MGWSRDQVHAFLGERTRIGRLATAAADGQPHVAPIWFEVSGEEVLIHTLATSAKARNIAENPRFALTVDKDDAPYKGVIIQGGARMAREDEIDWRPLIRRLAVAYMGPEAGAGMGEGIIGMPGEHVTLVLSLDEWEAWDYSQAG
ncbi:MAG: TIGR03618 family F420-dependent PPOX class oxidoreductase [Thermoleophilia bacterium]|jgi:PPOX class probable F420-dependent enzyme|nr:TIGR03618 family F420-dependent PPOX class oxidoreductase [Thermoleophilia bacterium]